MTTDAIQTCIYLVIVNYIWLKTSIQEFRIPCHSEVLSKKQKVDLLRYYYIQKKKYKWKYCNERKP